LLASTPGFATLPLHCSIQGIASASGTTNRQQKNYSRTRDDQAAGPQQERCGCRFTLAGLELSDKAEAQRAQALVRRHGGRRFTSQTLHLLQGVDKSNILALCPCSLTKHKITQLQSWADFTSGTLCCLCFAAVAAAAAAEWLKRV